MTAFRRLAERLSRGRVLKRHLPREFGGGSVYVTPDAALRFWRQNLYKADPMLFDAARELVRPGDVVWDVGANVGLFSFATAALAGPTGQVLAIEPDLLAGRFAAAIRAIPATHLCSSGNPSRGSLRPA